MTSIKHGVSDRHPDLVHERVTGPEPAPAPELAATLDAVRDTVLRLLSGFRHPPSVLRMRAGDVSVDAEWPVARPGPESAAATVEPSGPPGGATGQGGVDTPAAGSAATADWRYLCAPTVGVFFRAPEPGAPPFVEVGDAIVPGRQVAIVEAMKLMIPVEADAPGTIVEILKENGEPVEYGEELFAYLPPHS
jgi:acetyl-CoA carboxylase biotin carboxyl carrier protein